MMTPANPEDPKLHGRGSNSHADRSGPAGKADAAELARLVAAWFTPSALAGLLGAPADETQRMAHECLARPAARTHATLAARAFQACGGGEPTDDLRRTAVALECFREARLIHRGIEAGRDAPADKRGTPVALNVGDLLIGEGCRLIAESNIPPARKVAMLRAAAEASLAMTAGGDAAAAPRAAVRLGAMCAGAREEPAELAGLLQEAESQPDEPAA